MKPIAAAFDDWLEQRPRIALSLSLLLLVAVSMVHRALSHLFNFDFFYMAPVAIAARYRGRGIAIAVSAAAALEWFADDYWWTYGELHWFELPFGDLGLSAVNASLCFAIFLSVALLVSRLQSTVRQERRLSQTKSEMISLVSHQFNNALTAMGMAVTLINEKKPGAGAVEAEMIELLQRNLNTLKRTVENFLNEARLASGQFALEPRTVDAARMMRETVDSMESLALQKELELIRALPAGELLVKADPDGLSLVLSNLVSNAIKYTPARGKITVRASAAGRSAELSVTDTGIGMSRDELGQALRGFTRTTSGRRAAKGYGLGLKLTAEMLSSHGSRLDIESAPGKGSRFSFKLPLA